MNKTAILIDAREVSWECWRYLCMKCGVDEVKTRSLCLYVTGAAPITPADEGLRAPGQGEVKEE